MSKTIPIKTFPILFACSGCSNAGQLANDIARELNARGIAEMSCLAGVGAAKPHFLKQLRDREVWVIDGCPIECSLGVFDQVSEHVDVHIRLHELGVRKKAERPIATEFDALVEAVLAQVHELKKRMKGFKRMADVIHGKRPGFLGER